MERNLGAARLLPGKTLDNFDFTAVPMVSKAQVSALCAGDNWLDKGANLILFGPPGGGKSHLCSAIGLALVEKGWRVMLTKTSDLVQKLQIARRELVLEAAIEKLDRYHLLILDDFAYVTKDQAESPCGIPVPVVVVLDTAWRKQTQVQGRCQQRGVQERRASLHCVLVVAEVRQFPREEMIERHHKPPRLIGHKLVSRRNNARGGQRFSIVRIKVPDAARVLGTLRRRHSVLSST